MNILLRHILRRITSCHTEIINAEAIVIKESRRPCNHINRIRLICGINVLRLMTVADEDMMHVMLPNQIKVPAAYSLREGPVRIGFVLGEFEGEVMMRDDDLVVGARSDLELVLEPFPFCSGVVREFGQIAHQRDGVEEDETVSFVGESGVVANVVVLGELSESLDGADVVVSGEQVDGDIEFGVDGLECLDFVVEAYGGVNKLLPVERKSKSDI